MNDFDNIQKHLFAEREEDSPCHVTVSLMDNGIFRARMRFAPGMESAHGDGVTVADAIAALDAALR